MDPREKYVGRVTGPQRIDYNWRDTALYALAVGADENDLIYTYQKNMKCLPSFGVTPYWNAVNTYPQRPLPHATVIDIMNDMERELGSPVTALHMEHELIMHRPIDPIKGSLIYEDRITDIYDRGEGKGIMGKSYLPVYDEAGNLLCENIASTVFFPGGGFGGEKPPKTSVTIPEQDPDYVIKDKLSVTQNVLYRLTGDTNLAHVDPEVAKQSGFPRPFMQGLCSFGFACRMLIAALIPGEPERMKRMAVQMRNVCFPGDEIELQAWNAGEGKAVFRLVNIQNQKAILDKGVFEYK